ncbi:nicotinate (nicotinamide) nucleotide adenylyltransferase [bacterium]|jgi:nicotinate-nucleotide adenylyltransferase|nr:nicotinate (nicotinamide) nucleotide adenylyltransferase [bacterium]
MNIALFGGSFDPVHEGHLAVINSVLRFASPQIDKLHIVPSAQNPQKRAPHHSDADRLAQLSQRCPKDVRLQINPIEINQKGPIYTIDTVMSFRKQFPKDRLFLVIGADQYQNIQTWKEWETLLSLVTLLVAPREGDSSIGDVPAERLVMDPVPVSSTDIRNLATEKRS